MASSVKNGFEATYYFGDREEATKQAVILRGLAQNHRAIGTVLPPRADGVGYSVSVTSGGPSLLEMKESPEIKGLFVDLADQSLLGDGEKETPIRISDWARKQIKVLVEFYVTLEGKMTPVPHAETYGLSHPHKAENLYSQYIVFTKFTPYDRKCHWDSLAIAIKKLKKAMELRKLSGAEFNAFEAMLNENANPADIYNLPIFFSGEDRKAYILRLYGVMKTNKETLFWRSDLGGCFPDFMVKCRRYGPLSALTTKIIGELKSHEAVTLTPMPPVSADVNASNQQLYVRVNIMRQSYVHANSFIISSSYMCPFSPELLFGLVFPDHVQLLWGNHPV